MENSREKAFTLYYNFEFSSKPISATQTEGFNLFFQAEYSENIPNKQRNSIPIISF